MQEPHIYRMSEAVLHYGEAIKAIMNEECGKLLPREPLLECKINRESKFLRGLKRLVSLIIRTSVLFGFWEKPINFYAMLMLIESYAL